MLLILAFKNPVYQNVYSLYLHFFPRKLLGWNQWSLYLGYSISFGLSLIGNFQLHSVRTAGKNNLLTIISFVRQT